MRTLSPWLGRLVALALFVGFLLLCVVYVVLPAAEHHRTVRQDLAHTRDLIARLSRTGQRRELLQQQVETLEDSLIDSGFLLQSETDAFAAAELRETVERIMDRTGGELQSSQNLSVTDVEGFKRIAIRVALRGTIREFMPLLYELEAQRPYLFVETLEIKSRSRRKKQKASRPIQTGLLSARLDIYGYVLSEQDK